MPNARLKRLLDKKKNALSMPKHKLAELEDDYIELLNRIESEKKRLGIDPESINKIIESFKSFPNSETALSFLEKQSEFKKEITSLERQIRKAASNGDIENVEYFKEELRKAWQRTTDKALENCQISLL